MKKVSIIGCGAIAQQHAKKLKGKVSMGYFSRSKESALKMQKKFGGSVFEEFEEAVEKSDAVIICSPPEHHTDQILASLSAGKKVLAEKPLCPNRDELKKILSARDAAENLMVAENYYYKPSLLQVQDWVEAGEIGELQEVKIQKIFKQGSSGWKSAYGSLLEGGIHFVALLSAIVNRGYLNIEANFPRVEKGGHERTSHLKIEYTGGLKGDLRYSWETPALPAGVFQHSEVIGTKGRIVFESNGMYLRLKGEKSKRFEFSLHDLTGSQSMMEDFLLFLDGAPAVSNLEKAQRDLEIVFNAYKCANLSDLGFYK